MTTEINTTYLLSFTTIVCLALVMLLLFVVLAKMQSLYAKVAATEEKVGSTSATKDKVGSTPSTAESMEGASDVTVAVSGGLPLHSKLVHLLALVVAAVIALAVGIVLADGTSVIKLKPVSELPVITAPELRDDGFDYRIDELLGPTYGVGLHHDQAGFTWTDVHAGKTLRELIRDLGLPAVAAAVPHVISTDDLKHPVPFLECDHLKTAGLCAVSFGFIAEVVAVLMIIFHALAATDMLPKAIIKPVGGLVWLTLSAGFLIVVSLAVGIYTAPWDCNNPVIPSINLSDHFNYSYGFSFAVIGYISALLIFNVAVFVDGETLTKPVAALSKAVGGVVVGIVLCGVIQVVIMGGNGQYDAEPVDNSNPCQGQRPYNAGPGDSYFHNTACFVDSVTQTLEQAGANVTLGYTGLLDAADRVPITSTYAEAGLCPVNVHWHLGAEHLSVGQYDSHGSGPGSSHHRRLGEEPVGSSYKEDMRRLSGDVREGFQCHHYDSHDPRWTTEYNWQYCTSMHVGDTYEVHWPHSAAGACGTQYQYQTPFYDGVFCRDGVITIAPLNTYQTVGVQAQIFQVINDEAYYNANLFQGMVVEGEFGAHMTKYTGSTTGTTRDNQVCSRYTPITWQVDRKCHVISASSFDKMCQDMLAQADDMSGDVHPHGARAVVDSRLAADNQVFTGTLRQK